MHWQWPTTVFALSLLSGLLALVAAYRKPQTSFIDLESLFVWSIFFFHGACRSMQLPCMTTLAYSEIPPAKMSRAN